MKPKAVIFDLDGCLVDTENLHRHALSAALGRAITTEYFREHLMGLTSRDIMTHYGVPVHQQDAVIEHKRQLFVKLSQNLHLPENSCHTLDSVKQAGYRMAICSNNNLASIFAILGERVGDFDCVVSKDQVAKAKPHADPYVLALTMLGVQPDQVIAVEDSLPGIQSAQAAGINNVIHITVDHMCAQVVLDRIQQISMRYSK